MPSSDLKEKLINIFLFRAFYYYIVLIASKALIRMRFYYHGAKILMDSMRIMKEYSLVKTERNRVDFYIEKQYDNYFNFVIREYVLSNNGNKILNSYQRSKSSKKIRDQFSGFDTIHRVSIKYPRDNDFKERQGDLLILKKSNLAQNEKGVLYICYTESLGKLAALYDIEKLSESYQFVFEPSWWGYQNASFLFFYGLKTEIVIECPYYKDYDFIRKLNNNFHASRIGFGDWVDDEKFTENNGEEKKYDIVMVGNWSKVKRHEVLFKAVDKMNTRPRIALIGYPAFGRTKKDVLSEARKYNAEKICDIFENIPPIEVAKILSQSKINLLLSKGEGANRGIYEGMFCGNVVVVLKENKGVNMDNINKDTGYLSTERNLHVVLEKAIESYEKFDTRKWAKENTGYKNTSLKLNEKLKNIAKQNGNAWNRNIAFKKNLPNAVYGSEEERLSFIGEYEKLSKFLI